MTGWCSTLTLLRPFAYHLVGKMGILKAHLLITKSTTQMIKEDQRNHPPKQATKVTPLKTNMAKWSIASFNRRYIFKWWMFHCHVSFRVCIPQGIVGCTPTNVPLFEIPIESPYIVGIYGIFHPQESLG